MTAAAAAVRDVLNQALPRTAVIRGTRGELEIPNVWGSRVASTDAAVLRRPGRPDEHLHTATVSPMAAEADATIAALRSGRTEVPEMPWEHTRATARILSDWRASL